MDNKATKPVSRRRFLKTAGATALAASTGPAIIIPGRAKPKTLKLLIARSPMKNFDEWFIEVATAWGERNGIQVIVDAVGMASMLPQIASEATAQQGHDMVRYWEPFAAYEDHAIDHAELYQEAEHRYGKAHDFAIKHTYNPKTQKYHSFCDVYGPTVLHYRQDLWQTVDRYPDSWEDVRLGGRHIKLSHGHPIGFHFQPDFTSESTWRALLYSFGASVQDADNQPTLKSRETRAALEFGKALFDETMNDEMLNWTLFDPFRAMLAGEISLTLYTTLITRTGEKKNLPGTENILLGPPPQGPANRLAPLNWVNALMIWKFADNIDAAKRFAVDWIGYARDSVLVSKLLNLPPFPGAVPDWEQLVANDSAARPAGKYKTLVDADNWSTNLGYPGHSNVATIEVYDAGLIPKMFAAVAIGKMTPDEAMTQADQEVRKIFDKWRALGKV